MKKLEFGNKNDEYFSYKAKVRRVIDGDTVDVEVNNEVYRIRMLGIDTPESNQPGGELATHYLKMLIENETVLVSVFGQGIHKRQLGVIYNSQMKDINEEMVKQGYAWAYGDSIKASQYKEHEKNAKKERIGIWENRFAIEPWIWRKENMVMTEEQKARENRIKLFLENKRKNNQELQKRKLKSKYKL